MLLLAGCLAVLSGCGPEAARLYCGAGIRPPVAEAVELFGQRNGVEIACDYAGSEVLLSRIKLTQEGDLYMPGDTHYVELAVSQGLIASQTPVCYFVPVILVQKGNPKMIRGLADLTRPDVGVGLGDPEAYAVGRVSASLFEKNGIPPTDVSVKVRTVTVNELVNHVKLKTLDAAIVWDAVAAFAPDETEAIAIPPAQNIVSSVSIGILKSSKHPELAREFVEFITSAEGRKIFEKHHYTITLSPDNGNSPLLQPGEQEPSSQGPGGQGSGGAAPVSRKRSGMGQATAAPLSRLRERGWG